MEAWVQNPYCQVFCGMEYFQWQFPCGPSELVHFRKRIGEAGMEKIFQAPVALHGGKAMEKEEGIDTTVQEKNITFPTDTKLQVKVIGRCWKLAAAEGIRLRRSYRRELKKTLRTIRLSRSQKGKKKVAAAISGGSKPWPMPCCAMWRANCRKAACLPDKGNLNAARVSSIRNVTTKTRFTACTNLTCPASAWGRRTKSTNSVPRPLLPRPRRGHHCWSQEFFR